MSLLEVVATQHGGGEGGTSQHRGAWETTGSNTRRGYPNVGGCLLVGGWTGREHPLVPLEE